MIFFDMKKIIISLLTMFIVVSCADVGNKSIKNVSEKQVQAQIEEGVTTRKEINDLFGGPFETTFTDSGEMIYRYQYDDTTALTAETVGSVLLTFGLAGTKTKGQRNELTILFDENDIVKKFNMSNSDIETGTLLFAN